VGAPVPLLEVFYIVPVVTLISAVPIAVNGLGVTESASVLFYSRAGFAPDALVAAALLRRGVSLIVSLVGALFWLADRRRVALAAGVRTPLEGDPARHD
jgi:glycosyltransferase 2 family protein